jgi:two-component system, NtrC family, response regulator PilR
MYSPRILVVDDEEGMREVCEETLARIENATVVGVSDPVEACRLLSEESFDLLVTDLCMPTMSGVELTRTAREHDPDLPVVVITAHPSVDTAVQCLKLGAVDYIRKPFRPEELLANVRRFLDMRRLREEHLLLSRHVSRDYGFEELVGVSPPMRKVFNLLERVSETDVDVLITGETGTGKELTARALHRRSRRAEGRFVPVDCGAIPEHLMESEVFGYERGAFTGANARTVGLLEYASGGTFFLDEVGELPPLMQAKLLRALQERTIRRLGAKQEVAVDVRVVAATGRDLEQAVQQGAFRQDLLFRINVVSIQLPSLRERGEEDIRLLIDAFLARHGREMGRDVRGVDPQALEVLLEYRWPGNVRELQNVIRRGLALARGDMIQLEDLPARLVGSAGEGSANWSGVGFFELRARQMAAFEREYLSDLLRSHRGDVTAAAVAAAVPRGTYYRLLKNHGLRAADFRHDSTSGEFS